MGAKYVMMDLLTLVLHVNKDSIFYKNSKFANHVPDNAKAALIKPRAIYAAMGTTF